MQGEDAMHELFKQQIASLTIGGKKRTLSPARMTKVEEGLYLCREGDLEIRMEYQEPEEGGATWGLWLRNVGAADSPRITQPKTLDLTWETAGTVVVESLKGDDCHGDAFMPLRWELAPGESCHVEPAEGRSSQVTGFPYFDVTSGGRSLIGAIGWSGQWTRDIAAGPSSALLQVGLSDADFFLRPGEEVRLPSILLLDGDGDVAALRRTFRRLLLRRFSPQAYRNDDLLLPISLQLFDRYFYGRCPDWPTEAGQIRSIKEAVKCGHIDNLWLDAGWFKDGFPGGVGNYSFTPGFPNGLKPVSDAAHANGMTFTMWFEPERVHIKSETAREHPEFLLHTTEQVEWLQENLLFNLGDPTARDWMYGTLSSFIRDNGIDILRLDFNINPLPYWRDNDEEGRRGVTEMRYIAGLYDLWDRLLKTFPRLLIDDCSSGGRRIDFEISKRSVPLWRSDTGCSPETPDYPTSIWNQNQCLNLTRYLPFHACAAWEPIPYDIRAAQSGGLACTFDVLNPAFDFTAARRLLEELHRLRPLWNGDFYPLTAPTESDDVWSAYQLDREGRGVVYAFRRAACPQADFTVRLGAVDKTARYIVTLTDEAMESRTIEADGQTLAEGYVLTIPQPRGSLVLEYAKAE